MTVEPTPGDLVNTKHGDTRTIETVSDDRVVYECGRSETMRDFRQARSHGFIEHVPKGLERETFIRFGEVPEDERSYDASSETYEDGVSVYGCEEADGVFIPTEGQVLGVMLLKHRGARLVTGERVGTGADGEPLIQNVEVETELETPEGVNGFVPAEDA